MNRNRNIGWFVTLLLSLVICHTSPAAEPPAKEKPKDIYDRQADGGQQIAAALAAAKRENKRVLLQFGANWCGWCHKLHKLFHENQDIARVLEYEYEVVLIDVDRVDDKPHNAEINERYGNPTRHGLPVIVVLDAQGKQLTTQDTGKLEVGDHHDPAKVLAFLKEWQPPALSADEVLQSALARARAESKLVFLHFGAPWCGWCHRLDEYLVREEIAKVLDSIYVCVKIDVDRMSGGKAVDARYRSKDDKGSGIPLFAILDPQGQRLADSYAAGGNIGFPAKPEEIAHFLQVVRQTSSRLSAAQLAVLEKGLLEKPGKTWDVHREQDIAYLGPDRAEKLDLYMPAEPAEGQRFPGIVIIHGGGWTGGDKGAAREQNIGNNLAQRGYVCVSINYLLAKPGYPSWPQNLHDCKLAVRFLRKNAEKYHVDAERIGVIGGSAGGHLAAMVGLTGPEARLDPTGPDGEISCRVQAVVDLYGPATIEKDTEMLPGTRAQAPQLYELASPVAHISPDDPPVLILHGTADTTVPVSQSELLSAALKKGGVRHELVIVEGAPHTFHLQPKERDLRPLVIGFFDTHLKTSPSERR